jgi:cytochrome b561
MAAISLVGSNIRANGNRQWRFPCLVALVGIAGVLRDLRPTLVHWPSINLHAAFGMMLWTMLAAQFLRASSAAPLSAETALNLSRRLSRLVYLLLYVVFGAEQILRIAMNYTDLSAKHGSLAPLSLPPENLRDYFAYGVVALLMVRAPAALIARRPPALQMNALGARRG